MHTLSAHNVLDLWERVSTCPPVERALLILASANSDTSPLEPSALTVGECEERLLALHEAMFGSQLNGFAECPHCGEALELGVNIAELRAAVTSVSSTPAELLEYRGYDVRVRLLRGADLVDASRCRSVSDAHALLLGRSIVSASRRGRRVSIRRLPRVVVERLAQRLAECDPWAESLLDLTCPECRHEWPVLLDIGVFLWTEIRARAQRLLHDVHTLAMAYGWREADIVAMSSRRREAYLAMVGA
jgi:hypothetical protein